MASEYYVESDAAGRTAYIRDGKGEWVADTGDDFEFARRLVTLLNSEAGQRIAELERRLERAASVIDQAESILNGVDEGWESE